MKHDNPIYLTFIYILLVLLPIRGFAARQNEKQNYYDKWNHVSSEKLMSRAYDIINSGENVDSALIFYNVVYNRYVEDSGDETKTKDAIRALNDMGYLMTFYYYDFERAYSYLTQALEFSQQIGYEHYLPYIYVNIGNMLIPQRSYVSPEKLTDAVPYYIKGFHIAARRKDWDIMLVNFNNLMGLAVAEESPSLYNTVAKEVAYFKKLQIPSKVRSLGSTLCEIKVFDAVRGGRYEEAALWSERCVRAIGAWPDSLRYVVTTREQQANCLVHLGRFQEALDLLKAQISVVQKHGIKDLESEIYHDLMDISQKMGNNQMREHYEYLYLKTKDDMLFGNHKVAFLEQSRLMHMLSKANDKVRTNVRRQHYIAAAALVALVFVIVIAAFTVVVVRKNRRLRESNHSLYLQVQKVVKEEEKYKNSSLDDKRREEIVSKIEAVFADKELLCSEDMSLKRLSELTATPYKLVSQSINEHWQKNFSQLLAEYRIHEACRRMQDREHYGSYSIEGIGAGVGFHTRSNFVTTFKRITGLTPSEYLREAR